MRVTVVCAALAALASGASAIAGAQTGGWTWTGGSDTIPGANRGNSGVYGTLGVPANANIPGGRQGATSCTDASGNFWMFGGYGDDSTGTIGELNDLWEFSASTGQWVWLSGSSMLNGFGLPGVYGKLGVAAAGNVPGGRKDAACWFDGSGNFWLFGGNGFDSNKYSGYLNDLWEFNRSSAEWIWMGGSSSLPSGSGYGGQPGSYGVLGVPAAGNVPGGRSGAVAWTDHSGNFWLFGGMGYDSVDAQGNLNDLWEFNPSTLQWAWMSGSSTVGSNSNQSGVYGTEGVPAAGNVPGGRQSATGWIDSGGNLWLFGGYGAGETMEGWLNDLWEFNPSTSEWTWVGGTSTPGSSGIYGSIGVAAVGNIPGARDAASGWTDSAGNFWLFGGYGYDSSGGRGDLNDLWEFNPFTSEWTWVTGTNTIGMNGGEPGVYGTQGVIASGNTPGGRDTAASWIDPQGNLWLFGGYGYISTYMFGYLNDMWEYQPSATAYPAAPAPTFSVAAGTYTTAQQVSIVDSVAGATIYYTTNGTTPNFGSAVYSGPLTVNSTETIQAFATAPDFSQSLVSSATYVIKPLAAPPTFSLAPGSYTTIQTLSMADTTPGAAIYYTTDGTPPNIYSNVYSQPITVASSETVQAIAVASGYTNSDVTSASYVITLPAATPVFSIPGGTYFTPLTLTISDTTPGATIVYTTDGSTLIQYSGPITVSQTETIQATAVAPGYSTSAVASATYTIASSGFSPSSADFGPVNAGTASSPQTLTYTFGAPVTLGSTAVLTRGALGHDFADAGTGTCAANTAYAAGQTCTVNVTFTPKFAGTRYGAVQLNDTNGNVIATAYVQGTGMGPQLIFGPGMTTTLGTSFNYASGAAVDGNGNVYVVDVINNLGNVQEIMAVNGSIPANPTIRTLVGGIDCPAGPALDSAGDVYYADECNHTVNEIPAENGSIPSSPAVRTLTTQFVSPAGVAVDHGGNVYVLDASNETVNEIQAVNGAIPTSPAITTLASGFKEVDGIAIDSGGNLYVSDDTSRAVFEIHAVNGSIPSSPIITSLGSGFVIPRGIAVDGMGNVYVAEYYYNQVYELLAVNGSVPASPTIQTLGAGLTYANGVAVSGNRNVFVADYGDSRVVRLDYADAPSMGFASTPVGSTSADSPQTLTLTNAGNADLTIPIPASGTNPSISTNFTLDGSVPSACPEVGSGSSAPGVLAAGASCALAISFAPQTAGSLSGSVILTDNNLNATPPGYASQSVALSGTAVQATPTVSWSAPAAITYGTALDASQLNATASVPGTFAYSPAAGTVLGAGTQTLTVTFTPTDTTDYTTATATVNLIVNKATPVITWPTPAPIAYGTALSSTQLDATANLPGTFVYNPAAGSVPAAGSDTLSVAFTPTDTTDYTTAAASVTLTVNNPSFTLNASPASLSISLGKSGASTISVIGAGGFAGSVKLTISGLPHGVTATFSSNPVTSSTLLTFKVAKNALQGTTAVLISGVSGSLTASTTISLSTVK